MFGTMASTVLTLVMARGVQAQGGALVLEGALDGERVRAYGGRQDEVPMSRLQGGNLAPSYCCLDVLILRMWL
jgi:hypothetical protein